LAHLPYGSKSPETVRTLVKEGFLKLLEYVELKAKTPQVAVVACNTASAVALDVVEEITLIHLSLRVF
jgi:glutamate racemase